MRACPSSQPIMLWIGWFVLPDVARAAVGHEAAYLSEESMSSHLDNSVAREAVDLSEENGKTDADKSLQFLRVEVGSIPPTSAYKSTSPISHSPSNQFPAQSYHGSPYNPLTTGDFGGSSVNGSSHHHLMKNSSELSVQNPGVCCCPNAADAEPNPRIGCNNTFSGSQGNASFKYGFDRHGCVDGNLVRATQHTNKPYSRSTISCTGTCHNGTSAAQCPSNPTYSFTMDEWNNYGHATPGQQGSR